MDSKQSPSDDAERREPNPGSPDPEISDLEGDTLREECGVFGIFGHPSAAAITALGLHALQHRGQEAAGIVSFDGTRFHSERRLGLVGDTFSRREVIERLPGSTAVGHVRYSTTGAKSRVVLQGTGDWLMSLLPDDPENTILKRFKKNKPDDEQTDADQPPAGGSEGYAKPSRDSLKKLIEKPATH